MSLATELDLSPPVAAWFAETFREPTPPQREGWPVIAKGGDVLIAAPTGSGKTLAAFLMVLDRLAREALDPENNGRLADRIDTVYVSPLRALSHDIQRNLERPLQGIRDAAVRLGLPAPEIRCLVRTGDTPASERASMTRRPPHVLVTTPESLFILLTSPRSRERLRTVRTVIVDEIHAVARDKRGTHLALTLERLEALAEVRPARIGLSATQRPLSTLARWLVGSGRSRDDGSPACTVIDLGHQRDLDLLGEAAADDDLQAVAPDEHFDDLLTRIATWVCGHTTTLVFVNTRKLAERVAHRLGEKVTAMLGGARSAPPSGERSEPRSRSERFDQRGEGPQTSALLPPRSRSERFEDQSSRSERIDQREDASASDTVPSAADPDPITLRPHEFHVAAHHGSLSRERRLRAEERLKNGELKALVATASLELGIDIGHVDLVVQIGSPRGISIFLQRVGRSGHALHKTPKGRLLPMTRDELIECAALLRAVRRGRLDGVCPPVAPLDILAQQIVAHCAAGAPGAEGAVIDSENGNGSGNGNGNGNGSDPGTGPGFTEDGIFDLVRRAAPYAALDRRRFDQVLDMLSQGFETPRGRRGQHLFRDRMHGAVRARRGARLAALTSGGAIPDQGDYRVVLDPGETFLGTVNEDWAIESMAGDIFLLGSHSWRIRRIENGLVRVEDAGGAPPSIPFWLGEAPGRTFELSEEVSALRREVGARLGGGGAGSTAGSGDAGAGAEAERWVAAECAVTADAARQIVRYIGAQLGAVGMVPTREEFLVERFFDDAGGMQLVVHAPLGVRINRAFGLALRKRFCRSFNQELQAAATDDGILLSLGSPQTFALENLPRFLTSATIEDTLSQAFLGSPLFAIRWRWNAARSLAILRSHGGKAVPFAIQRMQSDDLLGAAFPEQTACQEHVTYPIEIPDHPLVFQTIHDCLHEASDLDGLTAVLRDIEEGRIRMQFRDTVEPSPFAHALLTARPYAFLDDAPLEERRARAVALRHTLPDRSEDLARLDPDVIDRVRAEAAWAVRDPDELGEALVDAVAIPAADLQGAAAGAVDALVGAGRAARLRLAGGQELVFAAERLREAEALWPGVAPDPAVALPEAIDRGPAARGAALETCVRGHLAVLGPVGSGDLGARLGIPPAEIEEAFAALQARGVALCGRIDPRLSEGQVQACDRSLLARIHRGTLDGLRRQIEPVSAEAFIRFLVRWQHLHPDTRLSGEGGTREAIRQLAGWSAPVAAWETDILSARVHAYRPRFLDALCLSGETAWGRLSGAAEVSGAATHRGMNVGIFPRVESEHVLWTASAAAAGPDAGERSGAGGPDPDPGDGCSGPAARILAVLRERGALFASEIQPASRLLPSEFEDGLKELVARGHVSSDGFAPLRRLLRRRPAHSEARSPGGGAARLRQRFSETALPDPPGRWHLFRPAGPRPDPESLAEAEADRLLRRYGVVFRDVVARETLSAGWREVHRALRRLEARGLVRGGRFVTGFAGEQFAFPDAVPLLRRERERTGGGVEVRISSSDPLNLVGILTPGPRVPAGSRDRLVVRDGTFLRLESDGVRR